MLAAALGPLAGCSGDPDGTSTGTTTGDTATGGSGGSGGTAGAGGSGGSGGTGGGATCTPGQEVACYTGPEGTKDVGACKPGVQTCKANGEEFGPCTGEVVPAAETCATAEDDNCDGFVNEAGALDCECVPGTSEICYTGPADTLGVGACASGMRTCLDTSQFGPCEGEVVPAAETCATMVDDDCDSLVNEEGAGCVCVPGTGKSCYTGPANTMGVGLCVPGMQACNAEGTGYEPCTGDTTPVTESCLTPGDDDCNGQINEGGIGCVCAAGMPTSCYTGPAGTMGVGICKAGTAMCNFDGTAMGPCMGEVQPGLETCATPGDENCNGQTNESGPGCACTPGTMQVCYTGAAGTLGVGTCKSGMAVCQANGVDLGPCMGEVTPAVEVCSTVAEEDCKLAADCGDSTFFGVYGSAGQQQAYSLAVTAQNETILAGGFTVVLPLGGSGVPPLMSAGGSDAFLAKLDANGAYVWGKSFGDASMYQEALAVAVDSAGNIYVGGDFDGSINFGGATLTSAGLIDGFLAKFSSNGTHLWSKRFGSAGPQVITHLAVDSGGNLVVLAKGQNSIDFGGGVVTSAGGMDVFLAKLDANGNHLFTKRFGGATDDQGAGLAVAGSDILVSMTTNGVIDFGGGMLTSAGGYDIMYARFSGAGTFLHHKQLGNGANQVGSTLAADGAGNALLAGRLEGSINFGGAIGTINNLGPVDAFVAKLDTNGTGVWVKTYGGNGLDVVANGVAAAANGDVVVTGSAAGAFDFGGGMLPAGGGNDVFVVRYSSAGQHLWSVRGGDAENQVGAAIGVDSNGQVPVTGYFDGTLQFPGGPAVPSSAVYDVFLAKLGN